MTETRFRADHVGSLLRPQSLLHARRQRADGKIGDEELRAVENAAIGHAVALRRRIDEAAKYVDLDDLALSPQCGFASIAEGGNLLTADEQFAKLALVAQTARAVWGD